MREEYLGRATVNGQSAEVCFVHDEPETYEDIVEASLKPCPRCGCKGIIEHGLVYCEGCGASTGDEWNSLDEAVEFWNDQPHVDELRAEVERLSALVAEAEYERVPDGQYTRPNWNNKGEITLFVFQNGVELEQWHSSNTADREEISLPEGWRLVRPVAGKDDG